ncbi:metalloregulator ArsR/SmtB family transcription factor [Sinorhizobium numidicum]|uniref:Metalloregulator ArsR/SmtB family transcription factor n=1 Tax=Sinorhizobium numidicum TaxID=680248 RepID=A0ABY8CVJ8_9HYPH|nr:metalloregulator ArsR/SmtB family transcription factor [Sinorhizobium numidicum]WEX76010.1 metalloregulator ArsR/SmtB family transcription factor [Sinorhizobium numidicum]WEX82669.1 metalloregulator ArsR/SmtB family transcription factor [Sinorhizobium numidicum]
MGTVTKFRNLRPDMSRRAGEAAALLKTLANQNRLMIICTLVEGEHSVGQLEELLGIRQPTLSQQLTVLRDARIVTTRRDAKQVFYRLAEEKACRLVMALYEIFCREGRSERDRRS